MRSGMRTRTWRQFGPRDRCSIRLRLRRDQFLDCPQCGGPLEARPTTRLAAVLPPGAEGFDLDCRGCRRFHPVVRHTPESLYFMRLRRLAAAVLRA
ncbi:MAG TPA: hypothetical protein VF158_15720 [Longimicrobiales bacterium]